MSRSKAIVRATSVTPAEFAALERGEKLEKLTDEALAQMFECLTEPLKGDAMEKKAMQARKDNFIRLVITTQRQVDSDKLNHKMGDKLGELLDRLKRGDAPRKTITVPAQEVQDFDARL